MRALLLPVGPDWFAVDMRVVREIVPAPTVTPIPTAPPPVLGVFNLRGHLVPLFDTRVLLGLPPAEGLFAAVLEVAPGMGGRGMVGLGASGPPEIGELGTPSGTSDLPASRGTFTVRAEFAHPRAVVLLDLARLFPPW